MSMICSFRRLVKDLIQANKDEDKSLEETVKGTKEHDKDGIETTC